MKKYKCSFCGTELTTDEKLMLELYNFSCNICDIMITVNPDKPETECITGRPGDSVLDIMFRSMRRRQSNE